MNNYCTDGAFLNYTRVTELFGTEKYNIVPRYHKCDTKLEIGTREKTESDWKYKLMLWDTDREKHV